jgi:hypothetical protein
MIPEEPRIAKASQGARAGARAGAGNEDDDEDEDDQEQEQGQEQETRTSVSVHFVHFVHSGAGARAAAVMQDCKSFQIKGLASRKPRPIPADSTGADSEFGRGLTVSRKLIASS